MRYALMLALAACGTGSLFAEAADQGKAESAKDAKAVNTVCVVCGKPVDAKVVPIAGKTKEGKQILIGCCSDACAAEVKKTPDAYADAAVSNKALKKADEKAGK